MCAGIDELLARIQFDGDTANEGKDRIVRTLAGESVDYLPLIFWTPRQAVVLGKRFNMKEQFYDAQKMLFAHLEEIVACGGAVGDAQWCLRPNFGTIFIPAMLGARYKVVEDTFPWITEHLTRQEIEKIDISQIPNSEMMQRTLEYIRYFRMSLPEQIHVYAPDTQGPFDIAHLLYGNDIFLALYDDPAFVKYLLEITTQAYILVSRMVKEALGEENGQCYHGHALPRGIFMKNGGVRVSEDSPTLISPRHIEEFVLPYVERCINAFGGGFIHFCGHNEHLLDMFLDIDGVRAIHFGNPEKYDFKVTMKKFTDRGKCYFGMWPKYENETLEIYIDRMMEATNGGKQGLVLHFDEEMFPGVDSGEIISLWRKKHGRRS